MEKYTNGNMVAVLYSRGFGAGWSTWNQEHNEEMMYDKDIVQLYLDDAGQDAILTLAESKWPNACLSGIDGLTIEWISEGTEFIIEEYDGRESVVYKDRMPWNKA